MLTVVSSAVLLTSVLLPGVLLAPQTSSASIPSFVVCDPQGGFANLNDISAVGDDAKGMYVAWTDVRSGTRHGIYAMRLDTSGQPMPGWPINGVAMSANVAANQLPIVVPDREGQAFVVWSNTTVGRVFAQRVNASGAVLWGPAGVIVQHPDTRPLSSGEATRAVRSSDGKLYVGFPYGNPGYMAIARLKADDGSLDLSWLPYQDVSGYVGGTSSLALVADANGGVFMLRNAGTPSSRDLYFRHFNAAGVPYPEPSEVGRRVGVTQGTPDAIQAVSDGGTGVYVAWTDDRVTAGSYDVYVIRLNADGTVFSGWPTAGLRVGGLAGSNQIQPRISLGSNGNLIVSWMDFRRGPSIRDIYATRVTPSGSYESGWAQNGVLVGLSVMDATRAPATRPPQMQPMPDGGTYFAWSRLVGGGGDVFGTLLSPAGVADPAGKVIADDPKSQNDAVIAMGDGTNVGVFWRETRSPTGGAALMGAMFYLDPYLMTLAEASDDRPAGDFRTLEAGANGLRFSIPLAGSGRGRLELFDLAGRRVAATDLGALGAGTHEVSLTPGRALAKGLYFARLRDDHAIRTLRILITGD